MHGNAYVVADDEHHVAVFSDQQSPGLLFRIVAGELPVGKKARKRRKPDLETLAYLPRLRSGPNAALIALGSGSRENRQTGVVIPMSSNGTLSSEVLRFDLAPLYRPLRAALGEINVEGAIVVGEQLLLLNRGIEGKTDNATARYLLSDVLALIEGKRADLEPIELRRYDLGEIDGVGLGFTDAAALSGGGWMFTAAAEDTGDSVADAACSGSVIGVVSESGVISSMHRLVPDAKVEGIDLHETDTGVAICLVTDSDEPAQSSWLLTAKL